MQLAGKTYARFKLLKWCSNLFSWEEINMTQSVRRHALDGIHAILNEGLIVT